VLGCLFVFRVVVLCAISFGIMAITVTCMLLSIIYIYILFPYSCIYHVIASGGVTLPKDAGSEALELHFLAGSGALECLTSAR
jgi:hypothetical protein